MKWSIAGAVALCLAVVLGAFGAHSLRGGFDDYSMRVYEKAVFYHFIHALGLLIVPALAHVNMLRSDLCAVVCTLLALGITVFSGSLYLLAVTGTPWLGAVAPFGGVCFIAAWFVLAAALARGGRRPLRLE
jgi:uncharacterized membrane protein YgdD (TMEM256/DUF423 family)